MSLFNGFHFQKWKLVPMWEECVTLLFEDVNDITLPDLGSNVALRKVEAVCCAFLFYTYVYIGC